MVAYCEGVINEIRSADTEIELRSVITRSINGFKTRNSPGDLFIMNMIVALQASKAEDLTTEARKNTIRAIEIFREHRRNNQELLF